jgi:hypothetical protein
MNYATVEDVIFCFPYPVLPSVTGEPDYHTLRAMLRATARPLDTQLGGGGHLGILASSSQTLPTK